MSDLTSSDRFWEWNIAEFVYTTTHAFATTDSILNAAYWWRDQSVLDTVSSNKKDFSFFGDVCFSLYEPSNVFDFRGRLIDYRLIVVDALS